MKYNFFHLLRLPAIFILSEINITNMSSSKYMSKNDFKIYHHEHPKV